MKAVLRRGLALILAICLVAALGICASAREYYHSGEYNNTGYGAAGGCTAHEAWVSMGSSSKYTLMVEGMLYYTEGNNKLSTELDAPPAITYTRGTKNIGPNAFVSYMTANHFINGSLVYISGEFRP